MRNALITFCLPQKSYPKIFLENPQESCTARRKLYQDPIKLEATKYENILHCFTEH